MHFFLKFMFWNKTLHVSDRFSLHHQESSTIHTAIGDPDPASTTYTYCCVYSARLLMMDREIVRNM